MKALLALFTILAVPLMLMNILGGIVSGIWLAILHEWHPLIIGVLSLSFAVGLTDDFVLVRSGR